MRSCALRILETEIISIALVIFLVFSTDLILVRSSLPDAMIAPCLFNDYKATYANDFLNAVVAAVNSASASLSIAFAASNLANNAACLSFK